MLISGEFDSIRLVSDDSYHFDTEMKDGKTTVKIGKTEIFHIFEFSNEYKKDLKFKLQALFSYALHGRKPFFSESSYSFTSPK